MKAPVFLDSSELSDLRGLITDGVHKSDALVLLGHMADRAQEPGLTVLDEVMASCHRVGDIDEQTLELWRMGSAESQDESAEHDWKRERQSDLDAPLFGEH